MSGLLLGNKEFAATWTTSSHLTTTKWRCLGYLENSTCCPLRGWIILMSNIRFVHKQRSYKVSILKSIFYLIRCSYWPTWWRARHSELHSEQTSFLSIDCFGRVQFRSGACERETSILIQHLDSDWFANSHRKDTLLLHVHLPLNKIHTLR